ncbi:hypothetical protein OIDMADRAFT_20114 [Oidiodendron maius Zn]|uniref:DUF427 domain-containing protein n=1 Tax=Oidiodendron maius (strain Zn) TaxID=913774 RepID=A0A0C3D9D0_OIDMZ|nr:hypothetical protein OIDMADRAFT_20114 [Oidiodendron maius Zn]
MDPNSAHHATVKVGDTIIAESDTWEKVEGNIYFPPSSFKDPSILVKSDTTTRCPWKGLASYYDLNVEGQTYRDSAWYYPEPSPAASKIKDYVAFYQSGHVKVSVS